MFNRLPVQCSKSCGDTTDDRSQVRLVQSACENLCWRPRSFRLTQLQGIHSRKINIRIVISRYAIHDAM